MDNQFIEKEDDFESVFAKPIGFPFQVAESKSEAFLKKDTRPAFLEAMKRFERYGGKIDGTK